MCRINGKSLQVIPSRQMHKTNLCKIMIFSGQPEYRHCSGLLRDNCYRDRFEQRECRAAEKRNLLSGNNGWSTLPEALNILQSLSARAKPAVLPFEHCRNPLATVLRIADALL